MRGRPGAGGSGTGRENAGTEGLGRLEKLYHKVTADQPDDVRSLNVKSVMALDNDRPAEAAELIGRALVLEPAERAYLFHMAKVCARAGWWSEVATTLRRAIYVAPRDAESWYGLGIAFEHLDMAEDAVTCWRQCVTLEVGHTGATAALARYGQPS